jgi:hypothetical protein
VTMSSIFSCLFFVLKYLGKSFACFFPTPSTGV